MDNEKKKSRAHDLARAAYSAKVGAVELAAALLTNASQSKKDAVSVMDWLDHPDAESRDGAIRTLDNIANSPDNAERGSGELDRFTRTVGFATGLILINAHIVMRTIAQEWGLPEGLDMWPNEPRRREDDEDRPDFPELDVKAIFIDANSDEEVVRELKAKMEEIGIPVPPDDMLMRIFKGAHEITKDDEGFVFYDPDGEVIEFDEEPDDDGFDPEVFG